MYDEIVSLIGIFSFLSATCSVTVPRPPPPEKKISLPYATHSHLKIYIFCHTSNPPLPPPPTASGRVRGPKGYSPSEHASLHFGINRGLDHDQHFRTVSTLVQQTLWTTTAHALMLHSTGGIRFSLWKKNPRHGESNPRPLHPNGDARVTSPLGHGGGKVQ